MKTVFALYETDAFISTASKCLIGIFDNKDLLIKKATELLKEKCKEKCKDEWEENGYNSAAHNLTYAIDSLYRINQTQCFSENLHIDVLELNKLNIL